MRLFLIMMHSRTNIFSPILGCLAPSGRKHRNEMLSEEKKHTVVPECFYVMQGWIINKGGPKQTIRNGPPLPFFAASASVTNKIKFVNYVE